MKVCTFAAAAALVCAAWPQGARADVVTPRVVPPQDEGIHVEFIGDGGVKYTFTHHALAAVPGVPDASFRGDDFFVAARLDRSGCILSTPWVPVPLTAGKALLYPHFKVQWVNGHLSATEPAKTLFHFEIAVRHANEPTSDVKAAVDTGHLELKATYRTDVYFGTFDGLAETADRPPLAQAAVKDGDSVQVRVCDVHPLVELTLHDVVVEVTP